MTVVPQAVWTTASAIPGRARGSSVSGGYPLVKALESFILPFLQDDWSSRDKRFHNDSSEARHLIHVLTEFVGSIISQAIDSSKPHSRSTLNGINEQITLNGTTNSHKRKSEDKTDNPHPGPSSGTIKEQVFDVELRERARIRSQSLLEYRNSNQRRMEYARDNVFNKMPIRLLMFNTDGSGIRLVDRSEIWTCIESQSEDAYLHKAPFDPVKYTAYAILSHTWLQSTPGEITFDDWNINKVDIKSPGYLKLQNFCKTAATEYGLNLAWMDTLCINKDSSTELDESIRSMYKWYERAKVCIVYLGDTTSLDDMVYDKWFTRGWTLQELLAPRRTTFFKANWKRMIDGKPHEYRETDTKNSTLVPIICKASNITEEELNSCWSSAFSTIPIWRRMQWAANRSVTRAEDTAYSMMGIFEVSMPTAYGEGAERAFNRLVREILNSHTSSVIEIVNWAYGTHGDLYQFGNAFTSSSSSDLIPTSPKPYIQAATDVLWYTPATPITLSHLGLCVRLLLMPGIEAKRGEPVKDAEKLICDPIGHYSATVGPIQLNASTFGYGNWIGENFYFNILDRKAFGSMRSEARVSIFAVFNFQETTTEVILPEGPCFALLDWVPSDPLISGQIKDDYKFSKTPTGGVITFHILSKRNSPTTIPKSKLHRHGMTLRTCYL